MYEGEVTELTPLETENPMGGKWICTKMSLKDDDRALGNDCFKLIDIK